MEADGIGVGGGEAEAQGGVPAVGHFPDPNLQQVGEGVSDGWVLGGPVDAAKVGFASVVGDLPFEGFVWQSLLAEFMRVCYLKRLTIVTLDLEEESLDAEVANWLSHAIEDLLIPCVLGSDRFRR